MTREEFAKKYCWWQIMWFLGIVNIFTMAPQLWKLIATKETAGLSLPMFCIALFMQCPPWIFQKRYDADVVYGIKRYSYTSYCRYDSISS